MTALLLVIFGTSTAVAEPLVSEQAIGFEVADAGGQRFCHAIIELPDHGTGE